MCSIAFISLKLKFIYALSPNASFPSLYINYILKKFKFKKGTGYFFCMNCPRVETFLSLPEKVACPLFSALKKRVAPIHFYPKSKPDPYIVNNYMYCKRWA